MPRQKGQPKVPGSGRKKGTQNKVSQDTKALMGEIVLYGLENGKRWLERTARKNPARALEALNKLAEFTMPKLAKTDISVSGGVQVLERRFYESSPPPILPAKKDEIVDGEAVVVPEDLI